MGVLNLPIVNRSCHILKSDVTGMIIHGVLPVTRDCHDVNLDISTASSQKCFNRVKSAMIKSEMRFHLRIDSGFEVKCCASE